MVQRSATFIGAVPGVIANIPMDVSPEEIAVANIDGNIFWPYIDDLHGRVPGAQPQALWDRRPDIDLQLRNSAQVGISISPLPAGCPAVVIGSPNSIWRATVPSWEGGLTVCAIVDDLLGMSSYGGTNPWWIRNDDSGRLYFKLGGFTSNPALYQGPLLSAAAQTIVVFVWNAATGTVKIRVNGVYELNIPNAAFATTAVHPSLQYGLVNDAGAQTGRYSLHGGMLAFNRALTASEITELEKMLLTY
jgi:hypothetical protein